MHISASLKGAKLMLSYVCPLLRLVIIHTIASEAQTAYSMPCPHWIAIQNQIVQQCAVMLVHTPYVCVRTHVCMCTHTRMYVYAHTYVCVRTHVCMCTHTRMYVYPHTYVCVRTHVCMCTHTRMYVHACITHLWLHPIWGEVDSA